MFFIYMLRSHWIRNFLIYTKIKKPSCTYVRIIIICILVYNKVSRLQTQIFKKIWEKIILFLQIYINMNWKKITKSKLKMQSKVNHLSDQCYVDSNGNSARQHRSSQMSNKASLQMTPLVSKKYPHYLFFIICYKSGHFPFYHLLFIYMINCYRNGDKLDSLSI